RAAFDEALRSANESVHAVAGVLAAKGSCLLAAEQYAEAFEVLAKAAELAGDAGLPGTVAVSRRKIGQGKQRIGAYSEAITNFRLAIADATLAKRTDEVRLIELLIAENRALTEPEFWIKSLPAEHLSDNSTHQFVEHLVRARHALDHGESATTSSELERAA